MVDLVFENQTEHYEWQEKFFSFVVTKALEHLELARKQVELGIQLVSSEKMQELNFKHRQKDKPTDVLSFPLNDITLAKYDILPLGDIFICPDVVVAQAAESKIPVKEEMARLIIHGILHLLGYDHEQSLADDKKMLDLQEEILNQLSFRNG
ncbi:MAG: rRNA maturation RNase YbeY [Candidatus Yanofskybacteria bacterium RIFCSPLOWO2_02_FULL_47_9b]|uniref:Endoribonuclease YbeY n=1 Tax=Candidatus Yanofskybacteria bacterium RIFCSPLOWO2_02_FULL_47_9b TaxID=1802708 RepID=A0A1F8H9Q6_9BACT|nr:MAG: rRNA maturation RNase YbeY [Candidatus Yanofskybacteria bacterium RIFCSPLOWO2_02_FULL_47_9b]